MTIISTSVEGGSNVIKTLGTSGESPGALVQKIYVSLTNYLTHQHIEGLSSCPLAQLSPTPPPTYSGKAIYSCLALLASGTHSHSFG